ncbi:MAG: hypothetical protein CBC24_02875 [Candidatus Pelagibacter sp. TMED64]|nr:hypothetical protein [Candidatus Pelagibacter sp.]OUU66681.1 MAG: hypothetical protein CBC24_02875 [Candidatus Pelagibacter sp. TMED64]|tara:strand:- start:228 stop:680 length:453 start_codon:yes stop_codon:yes gene_type:complete
MNIRIASKEDIKDGIKEIIEAVKEFPDFHVKGLIVTNQYYETLINLCMQNGKIIIAKDNNKIIGCIMGLINGNVFTAMNELVTIVTWVHKDKRTSSAFYRMFKMYKDEFTKLKQNNKIDRVLMAQLANDKTNIKFDKLNFKLIEKTYEWR